MISKFLDQQCLIFASLRQLENGKAVESSLQVVVVLCGTLEWWVVEIEIVL
jgi:hypothetical protein